MIRITSLRNTCTACPAQWEGKLSDGQDIYIRYRWGHLDARIGPTLDEAILSGGTIFEWYSDNSLDGFMTYEELKELTKGKFILPDTDNGSEDGGVASAPRNER